MPSFFFRPSRPGSASKRILLAIAVATVGVGVLIFVFASNQAGPQQGSQGQGLPPVGAQPGVQLGGPGDQQVARNVDISFVDRNDPSRTQARMIAQQMAPQGSRGYIATTPRMWIFQTSGQTIHVKANQGDLAMPARSQPPERGTLTGDVLIRVYEAGADTSPQAIDADDPSTQPAATFRTPALDFNVELGTISTQETVTGTATGLVFEVHGLDVRGNQVTNQLERIESFRGGTATYTSPQGDPSPPAAEQAPQPAPQEQPPPPQQTPGPQQPSSQQQEPTEPDASPAPVETFYLLQLQDNVVITRGSMTTSADTLEAWVRLVDDQLPEGAIAPLTSRPHRTAPLGTTARVMAALLSSIEQDLPEQDTGSEPITLSWQGSLVARPVANQPRELATDDVALRLSAPRRGLVQVSDSSMAANGHAATIDYYPTTQRAILLGPAANSVFVTAPGVGEARGIRVELDLLSETAAFIGPGQLTSLGEDQQGRIAWAERADMTFRRIPASGDSKESTTLKSAIFRGKVNGQAQDARLAAETIDVRFFDAPTSQPLLQRLVMHREPNEPARASSVRTGSLSADLIEVLFELDDAGEASLPRKVLATGSVRGEGQQASFQADALDADLAATLEDTQLRTEVEQAELTGNVSLKAADAQGAPVRAAGGRVYIKPTDQYVEIEASDGQTARASRADTQITGPQIRLDATNGQAQVFGPGSLTHELRREGRTRPSTLTLGWDNFMVFDDTTGRAEADGNARINLTDNRSEEDRLLAANIQLAFTPPPQGESPDPDLAEGQRELLWARAEADPAPGSVVIIESRRYAGASAQDRTLESALVLMAPEATVDGPTSNIEAIGQGRAIILERPDQTPLEDQASPQRARSNFSDLAGGGSGQALIDWQGSMTFDRAAQTLVLDRAVRLSHRTGPEAPQLDLDCQTLTITLEGLDRSRSATTLRRAVAEGAVYAATDDRELVARSLDYDARTGVIIASGDPMAPVVVFDKRSAQPASAASVRWNINTGEFTIVRPLPAGGAIPGGQ